MNLCRNLLTTFIGVSFLLASPHLKADPYGGLGGIWSILDAANPFYGGGGGSVGERDYSSAFVQFSFDLGADPVVMDASLTTSPDWMVISEVTQKLPRQQVSETSLEGLRLVWGQGDLNIDVDQVVGVLDQRYVQHPLCLSYLRLTGELPKDTSIHNLPFSIGSIVRELRQMGYDGSFPISFTFKAEVTQGLFADLPKGKCEFLKKVDSSGTQELLAALETVVRRITDVSQVEINYGWLDGIYVIGPVSPEDFLNGGAIRVTVELPGSKISW